MLAPIQDVRTSAVQKISRISKAIGHRLGYGGCNRALEMVALQYGRDKRAAGKPMRNAIAAHLLQRRRHDAAGVRYKVKHFGTIN